MSPDQSGYEGDWRGRGRFLRAFGLGRQSTPPPLKIVRSHDLLHHAHREALLETAELAPIPPSFVHWTVLVCETNIFGILLNRPLEEPFTALARANSVVLTGGRIPADGAQLGRRLGLLVPSATHPLAVKPHNSGVHRLSRGLPPQERHRRGRGGHVGIVVTGGRGTHVVFRMKGLHVLKGTR